MSLEARRPGPLARTRPPGAALSRSGLSRALPEVGDTRGGRDRTHVRTPLAPRRCSRSRIAFSRRTSRKAARNKPQRNSCQLRAQAPESTTSVWREDGPAHGGADALCRGRRVVRRIVALEDGGRSRAADSRARAQGRRLAGGSRSLLPRYLRSEIQFPEEPRLRPVPVGPVTRHRAPVTGIRADAPVGLAQARANTRGFLAKLTRQAVSIARPAGCKDRIR